MQKNKHMKQQILCKFQKTYEANKFVMNFLNLVYW